MLDLDPEVWVTRCVQGAVIHRLYQDYQDILGPPPLLGPGCCIIVARNMGTRRETKVV